MSFFGMVDIEFALLAAAVAAGLWPAVSAVCQGMTRGIAAGALGVWLLLTVGLSLSATVYRPTGGTASIMASRPLEVRADAYVSSQTCRACHPREYGTWHASYHRTMTQAASPQSILAPWHGVTLDLHGRTYHLQRRGDEFWVDMDDPDADERFSTPPRVQRRIVMTTGSHHLQVYWYETGRGRKVEQFPFDYRIDEARWIPDHASFIRPPWPEDQRLPVAAPGQWDVGCIQCHSTRGQPRLDLDGAGSVDTHVAEFGISCEACHGPAEAHVRINRDPRRRYGMRLKKRPDDTIVQPERLDHRLSAQVCGQCHGIFTFRDPEGERTWRREGYPYRPGDDLEETRFIVRAGAAADKAALEHMRNHDPSYVLEDSFWADGMVRVTGREYNGLIETPCFQRGEMSCLSCHVMHKPANDPRPLREWANDQLRLGHDGNAACLGCHESFAADISAHTYHQPESSGSVCYNCHMPFTVYGLHKAVRSHQIDSPTVAASLATGRPNACNQCHLDKTLAWSAEHLHTWYNQPVPEMGEDEQSIAASLLWLVKGDAGQRGLMAWSFGWDAAKEVSGTNWMGPFLSQLLMDPYDAVRFIAYRSLRTLPGYTDFEFDFVAPSEKRRTAAIRAGQLWMRQRTRGERFPGKAVLMDEKGNLLLDQLRRISSERDDRPILLRE